jgi:hypothetical protein
MAGGCCRSLQQVDLQPLQLQAMQRAPAEGLRWGHAGDHQSETYKLLAAELSVEAAGGVFVNSCDRIKEMDVG